ncbi:MAG TPA: hypothetical protein VFH94_20165 [Streptomyces sp.]|nr:hypothetical protein [Streptomyces sp.]
MMHLPTQRFAVQQQHITDGLGFGEACGNHPVSGVGGGLAQLGRRLVLGASVVLVVLLFVNKPSGALVKGTVTGAVVLTLFGLTMAWRRTAARFGLRRCYLYAGGLVVTNVFGRVRDVVAWSEVTVLNRMVSQSPLMAFHRFELARRSSATVAFLALGLQPALVDALLSQAQRNGIR